MMQSNPNDCNLKNAAPEKLATGVSPRLDIGKIMVYSIAGICVVGHLAAWSYAGWVLVSDIYQAVTAGTISPTLLLTLILILMGISFFAIGMGLVYLVQMIYQSFCLNKTR